MRRKQPARPLAGLAAIVFAGLICCAPLPAADNTQAFLDGLRQRNLYDIALQLLEALREDPKTDKAFRETFDYQFGVTLIGAARDLPLEKREKQLDKARQYLDSFLSDHPQHPLADSASRNIADLKIERGESMLEEGLKPGNTPEEKQRWLEQARAKFAEAQKSLIEIDTRLVKKKKRGNKLELSTPELVAERDRLVAEMMLTRFSLSKTFYDLAQTYPKGGKENKTLLRKAVDKFSYFYWKYNRWLGGLSFRLEHARCHKELGEYERALEILVALSIPNPGEDDGFRRLRAAATKMAMEICLLPEVKNPKEAWVLYEAWEQDLNQPGRTNYMAPEISYLGGEAALELARGLAENDPQQARLRRIFRDRAKKLLSSSARQPGEYQLKARLKLTDPLLVSGEIEIEPPKSYEEARDRANVAWNQCWQPDMAPKQVERMRAEALECLRFALAYRSAEAKADELNTLRYRLAYLDWIVGEHYDAAVLGEFLARRYTDRPEGLQGAKIALAAYSGILQDMPSKEGRRFAADRIENLALFATEHWPKDSVAADAWLTLIRPALKDDDPAKAMEFLRRIAADSPRRGMAELLVGQSLWRAYLKASKLPKQQQPTEAKMTGMIAEARQMISDGIERLRKEVDAGGETPYSLAVGTLTLAKICLEQHQGAEAIRWLDDPYIGAHAFAKSDTQTAARGTFRVEAFKTALQAYVATEQMQKAAQAMDDLEKAAPSENLAATYITLGRELEKTLKGLQSEGNQIEADKAARGFELFLTRIANRPVKEITFDALYWVAERFVELGNSSASTQGELSSQAAKYYQKAALTFNRIVEISREDKEYAPREGTVEAIQIKLARCLRRLDKHKDAMDLLVAVLAEHNNLIDAQCEAAYTYQDWGRMKPGYYELAIRGGRKARQKDGNIVNLVWGWIGIAAKVQFDEKHQDIFFEARYNTALCRLKYALSLDGNKKVEQLRQAAQDVLMIQRLRPKMGGKKWYDKFDELLKQIQEALGMDEDQRGLEASEKKFSMTSK
ncbi:MAG: hypothetical protein JW959_09620 [Pirellulales bacterium]|nr:hypothetical protein [Pirellulales bacterium]